MASINFIDFETVIPASWLNEVDALVHDVFGAAATPEAARAAISAAPAFKGVLLVKDTNQTFDADVQTPITFDTEIYDLGNFFDKATNASRIVIPSGVNYVRFVGQISWSSSNGPSNWLTCFLIKNGVLNADPGGTWRLVEQDATNGFLLHHGVSAVLPVSAGDYFELYGFHSGSSGPRTVHGSLTDRRTWFFMEVVG